MIWFFIDPLSLNLLKPQVHVFQEQIQMGSHARTCEGDPLDSPDCYEKAIYIIVKEI